MIFLDTAFLYAYLVKEDVHHRAAVNKALELNDENIYVTRDVLKELVTVLTYNISSEVAITLFDYIITSGSFRVAEEKNEYFEEAMMIFRSLGKHKFSYVDCSLITLVQALECTVLTFDKKLERALNAIRK